VALAHSEWPILVEQWHLQFSWMWVNFVLAVMPALMAFVLHHWWKRLWGLRWLMLGATVLLLPNAPYVVTDLIHLRGAVGRAPGPLVAGVVVVPMFALLIGSGVLGYAYCMHALRRTMRAAGWARSRRAGIELSIDAVCAVGVALGRISRLNSWDIVRPDRLADGLRTVGADPRGLVLALVVVVLADVAVDRAASGAVHRLRSKAGVLRH
jgi:uncharacterized membrane protein